MSTRHVPPKQFRVPPRGYAYQSLRISALPYWPGNVTILMRRCRRPEPVARTCRLRRIRQRDVRTVRRGFAENAPALLFVFVDENGSRFPREFTEMSAGNATNARLLIVSDSERGEEPRIERIQRYGFFFFCK